MAEGLLDGVLGGEEEKIDANKGGTEPTVAAVAANLANQNPEAAAETAAMFREQTQLLKSQRNSRCGLHTRAVTIIRDMHFPKASTVSLPPQLLR